MFPHSTLKRTGWTRRSAKRCQVTPLFRATKHCSVSLCLSRATELTTHCTAHKHSGSCRQTGCPQRGVTASPRQVLMELVPTAPLLKENAPWLTHSMIIWPAIPGRALCLSGPSPQFPHQEHDPMTTWSSSYSKFHKSASSGSFLCPQHSACNYIGSE